MNNALTGLLSFTGQQLSQIADKFSASNAQAKAPERSFAFAFGDPEPILGNSISSLLQSFTSAGGWYYTPPVDLLGLAQLMRANSYHGPILYFKRNMIVKWFAPSHLISNEVMERAALDYVVTGNCYFQRFYDRFGNVVRLGYLPALRMRRHAKQEDTYVQLVNATTPGLESALYGSGYIEFQPGEVVQLQEYDLEQGIYGVPQYLGGIQSVLLSEASTLFRRKYYVNGAHLGYILVTNDANISPETEAQIEQAVKQGKGAGNFRSLYMNVPKSNSREPVKVIPIGSIGSNDEFQAIKEVTEMEMLAMHRVPPNLAAIIPANNGGFGDLIKTLQAYHELEVQALQGKFLQLNEVISGNPVVFNKPDWGLGV